jgi:hypothetical protein
MKGSAVRAQLSTDWRDIAPRDEPWFYDTIDHEFTRLLGHGNIPELESVTIE